MTPGYSRVPVTLWTKRPDQIAVLNALALAGNRQYSKQLLRVDDTGTELEDLTPYLTPSAAGGQAAVSRDCTAECPGKLTGALVKPLRWGSDRIMPISLIRSPGYGGGSWQGFPRGIYVATSPGVDNLDSAGRWDFTGWDRIYLLQSDPINTWSFAGGTTYLAAVQAMFRSAGIISNVATLDTVCAYPGDWAAKTLPAARSYPAGGGTTRVQIINALLKESGMRPLYTDPGSGQWTIEPIRPTATQDLAWRWQGSSVDPATLGGASLGDTGWPDRKILLYAKQAYAGDVYNAPNRWVFIQSGLTFQPTHSDGSDGRYIVDNLTTPPADQTTVGRVLAKVVQLDASGSADLIKQGDGIVADDLASIEKINLTTAPWPAAGHYDVFWAVHSSLPNSPIRRVQAQSWSMPLDHGEMTWQTNVVAQR